MAAAGTIERLYRVTVDGSEAVRQLTKIAASTGNVDAKLDGLTSTLKKVGAALAGALSVGIVVNHIQDLSESFDQLGKDASKVGVAVEELQRLRYAADLAGVSSETMDKAITGLSVSIQHLDTSSDDATATLKAIGVTGADSATQALEKIADRFASLPDGIEKTSEAVALFGKRAGPDLIPMLNDGAEGVAKLAAELDKFGGVISQNTIDQASAFNDNVDRLSKTVAGAASQFTAGLLPALAGLSQNLVDVVSKTQAFRDFGEGAGTVFVALAQGAVYVSELFRTLGTDIGALIAVLDHPTDAIVIFKAWREELKRIDDETVAAGEKIRSEFAKAKGSANEAGEDAAKRRQTQANAVKEAAEAAKLQADAEKRAAEARRAAVDAAQAAARLQEQYAKILRDTTVALEEQKQAEVGIAAARAAGASDLAPLERRLLDLRNEQTNAFIAWNTAQEDAVANEQIWRGMLDESADKTDAASNALRAFAQAQLNAGENIGKQAEEIHKLSPELDAFSAGWEGFVDALSSGAVTVQEAFKGMVQSIIADLLKIWAKKYILDAIFGPGGGAGVTGHAAMGAVFSQGAVQPFAVGGIISQPVRVPMALMGEAGPEAVMPLRRGSDGRLGVSGGAAALNVAIHNHTDARVSAQRDERGDLQVLIEQTRRAVAADIRRGGSDISRAAEAAWRLSRGSASAL